LGNVGEKVAKKIAHHKRRRGLPPVKKSNKEGENWGVEAPRIRAFEGVEGEGPGKKLQ